MRRELYEWHKGHEINFFYLHFMNGFQLSNYLKAISPQDESLILPHLFERHVSKGHDLVRPGEVQRELYFVVSGVQMSYFMAQDRLHVVAFTYAPGLCALPDAFALQLPAEHCLTCLTDSHLMALPHEALQNAFNQSHALERLFRQGTEQLLAGVLRRQVELQSLSMAERFEVFCNRSGHLLQQVPHKYLASYLAMDPTNFSKLYNNYRF